MTRLSIDKWRTDWQQHIGPPDARDHQREERFLEDHWNYGALIHRETATALLAALAQAQDVKRRHTLCLRLFSELATALETLGAWGWALQRRRTFRLFLDGFLSYPHTAPETFFRAAQTHQGDLVALLYLPPRARIIQAARGLAPASTARDVGQALDAALVAIKESADQYFTHDMTVLRIYNKAKHGATMLRLNEYTHTENDFQVIAPQRELQQIGANNWYDVAAFQSVPGMIERMEGGIGHSTGSIQHLAILAWAMQRAGLLYVDPAAA